MAILVRSPAHGNSLSPLPVRPGPTFDPATARRLDEARDYRAELLRSLWAMRRNPYKVQAVRDRRRELALTRQRIARLAGQNRWPTVENTTKVGQRPPVVMQKITVEPTVRTLSNVRCPRCRGPVRVLTGPALFVTGITCDCPAGRKAVSA